MSLDMCWIFILNHPILNLGFWRAKRCQKLKQEASAKKAKAVNKLLLGSSWCLCLYWPLRSVCPSIVSIRSLFCCRSFLFYEEYCKTFIWGSLPATLYTHCQSVPVVSDSWFGCALFHRRTSAPTRLAEAVPLVDFAFSPSLDAWRAISWANRTTNLGDPTCSLLQFHDPPILWLRQVSGPKILTTEMFPTSLQWRMPRMYCAKCPARYPAKLEATAMKGGKRMEHILLGLPCQILCERALFAVDASLVACYSELSSHNHRANP